MSTTWDCGKNPPRPVRVTVTDADGSSIVRLERKPRGPSRYYLDLQGNERCISLTNATGRRNPDDPYGAGKCRQLEAKGFLRLGHCPASSAGSRVFLSPKVQKIGPCPPPPEGFGRHNICKHIVETRKERQAKNLLVQEQRRRASAAEQAAKREDERTAAIIEGQGQVTDIVKQLTEALAAKKK